MRLVTNTRASVTRGITGAYTHDTGREGPRGLINRLLIAWPAHINDRRICFLYIYPPSYPPAPSRVNNFCRSLLEGRTISTPLRDETRRDISKICANSIFMRVSFRELDVGDCKCEGHSSRRKYISSELGNCRRIK